MHVEARIANTDMEPSVIPALQEEKAEAMRRVKALTADVTAPTGAIHQLERSIQVLALENYDLRSVGAERSGAERSGAKLYRCTQEAFQADGGWDAGDPRHLVDRIKTGIILG